MVNTSKQAKTAKPTHAIFKQTKWIGETERTTNATNYNDETLSISTSQASCEHSYIFCIFG